MRFALVSDIHANRQAWQSTLADIKKTGVDSILCLGDVVGYGPMPEEVLESVCREVDEIVLGNHDAVVGGRMEGDCFSDEARRVIDWTRVMLDDSAEDLFARLPAMVEGDRFLLAHGEVFDPERFGYIETQADARENFDAEKAELIFVGHTHYPGIFMLNLESDAIRTVVAGDFTAQPGVRYIVNVGSVGDPRDGGAISCYCIFDDRSGEVFFRRVPFDVAAYERDLTDRGLDIRPVFLTKLKPEPGQAPAADWSVQVWTPSRERTERPGEVVRVRHMEHGMTRTEEIVVAEAEVQRQQLAEALKASRLEDGRKRQARAEAAAEALRKKQEAAEEARRQKAVEDEAAAEQARLRKLELAKAVEARRLEKEREKAEDKARTELLLAKKQEALEKKRKEEEEERHAGATPSKTSPPKPDEVKKKTGETPAGASAPVAPPETPQPQAPPRPVLEVAGEDEPAAPVQAEVAPDAETIRQRRIAVARAAQEKKDQRLAGRDAARELVKQAIKKKQEAARRAKEAAGGGDSSGAAGKEPAPGSPANPSAAADKNGHGSP